MAALSRAVAMSAIGGKRTLRTALNLPKDHGYDEKAEERGGAEQRKKQ